MKEISDQRWHELVDRAFDSLPETHRDAVRNVAIVLEDDPSEVQRERLKLRGDQTLLGLYTGVPLPERQGRSDLPPDVITLFKNPLLAESENEAHLYENVHHTLWHEVAHYFGLDHKRIHELE
jgi:predicted Zn-dependent protease with MMP-like domain